MRKAFFKLAPEEQNRGQQTHDPYQQQGQPTHYTTSSPQAAVHHLYAPPPPIPPQSHQYPARSLSPLPPGALQSTMYQPSPPQIPRRPLGNQSYQSLGQSPDVGQQNVNLRSDFQRESWGNDSLRTIRHTTCKSAEPQQCWCNF